MRKARQARIVIDSIDGSMMASAHGESGEIVDAMVDAVMQMCKKKPFRWSCRYSARWRSLRCMGFKQ